MDKLGANFEYSVSTLHDRLQANAAPIQLPIGAEDEFEAIIDLVEMKCFRYTNDLGTEIDEIEILTITKKELKKLVLINRSCRKQRRINGEISW